MEDDVKSQPTLLLKVAYRLSGGIGNMALLPCLQPVLVADGLDVAVLQLQSLRKVIEIGLHT